MTDACERVEEIRREANAGPGGRDISFMLDQLDAATAELRAMRATLELWQDAVRCESRDCGCSDRIEALVTALKEQG